MLEFIVGTFAIVLLFIVVAFISWIIDEGGCGCLLFLIIAPWLAWNFGDWILSLFGR